MYRPATNILVSYSHTRNIRRRQGRHPGTPNNKTGFEELAQWEVQDRHHQHICPTYHQLLCWYKNLAKGGHGHCRYEDL